MFVICLHTKFHIPSLFVSCHHASEGTENCHMAFILVFYILQIYDLNKSCMSFQGLLLSFQDLKVSGAIAALVSKVNLLFLLTVGNQRTVALGFPPLMC